MINDTLSSFKHAYEASKRKKSFNIELEPYFAIKKERTKSGHFMEMPPLIAPLAANKNTDHQINFKLTGEVISNLVAEETKQADNAQEANKLWGARPFLLTADYPIISKVEKERKHSSQ